MGVKVTQNVHLCLPDSNFPGYKDSDVVFSKGKWNEIRVTYNTRVEIKGNYILHLSQAV